MKDVSALGEDLRQLVDRAAERFGDKTFLVFGDGRSLSFADFASKVEAYSSRMRALGVDPGQRVALMMKNSLEYSALWLGVVTSGAVAVPTNSRLNEVDARFIYENSGAIAVIVDEHTRATARSAASDQMHVIHKEDMAVSKSATEIPGTADLGPESLANIQYTSGTTGFPKGCMLTHAYWQQMGALAVEVMELTDEDTLLTSQPHSYIDPQWHVIAALRSGARLVVLDSFHPSTFMHDVARFEVTVFYCLGVMPTLLLKQPDGDVDRNHSVTRVYCSAIPTDRHAEIEARWGVSWMEMFGMTESGINTAVLRNEAMRFTGTGCIGRALAHNEAAVVDPEGNRLPEGTVGELVLRGSGFMQGYHDDPDATAEFFRDGWAHTGDLAEIDSEGYVYYRGRRKEMIRRAGENIAPVEVETALASHPDVVECAVTAVPDPDLGEEAKAYVVLREGAVRSERQLHTFLSGLLASFKVPRYWEFRSTLPHTPSERIAKHELEKGREDFRSDSTDMRALDRARG